MIRTRAVVLVLAVSAAVGSCSVGPPSPTPTASPTPTPTVPVSSEALVEAGLTEQAPTAGVDSLLGVVPCEVVATDRYGTYVPTCLRDDAPVLQFDPVGEWSWVVTPPGAPMPLDPDYVASAVDQAGRLLVDMIDSTAQWDDSPEAWVGIGSRVSDLLGVGGDDLRASVTSRPDPVGMFDAGDWRESTGIRPAAYPADTPRIRLLDLRVTGMSVGTGSPATRDNVGVTVTVRAAYTQPVVTADGTTWALRQWVSLEVSSLEATGAVRSVDWTEDHVVGLALPDGQASLPELPVEAALPAGWSPHTLGALAYALPADAVLAEESDPAATTPWQRFSLGAGESAPQLEISGPQPDPDAIPEGDWYVVPGFENYGLDIPGAEVAAAEIGTDERRRFRVRVFVTSFEHGSKAGYTLEWDTTPERAEAELRQVVSAMSINETT